MENQVLIDTLSQTILQNHSFDFRTFAEAKQTITMDGGRIQYTYDRLSLVVLNHTLSDEEYTYLGKKLQNDYHNLFSREDQKQRSEYAVLQCFISFNSELSDYSIQKETRPDFVLLGKQRIGIEVTEFTTQADSVLAAICNQNYGKGLSAQEIKSNAITQHGQKAKIYHYHENNGKVMIGSGLQNLGCNREIYADEIVKKYNKYKDEFQHYDKFIVLCDARWVLGITSEWEVNDVIEKAKESCEMSNFTVCILYSDELSHRKIATFVL